MNFHEWFGRHSANLKTSHWDGGDFVSRCIVCDREMIKLPGLRWQMRQS